jgi:hypothetical protein
MKPILAIFCLGILCLATTSLQAQPAPLDVPDVPARLSLIQISVPDPSLRVTVTGAAGSVPANARVSLVTLETRHFANVQAGSNGAFTGSVFAPFGSSILIRVDTRSPAGSGPTSGPGTIIRVPERSASSGGVAFGGAGAADAPGGSDSLPPWTFEGTVNAASFQPGDPLNVSGTLQLLATNIPDGTRIRVRSTIGIERLTGPDGIGTSSLNAFSSASLTPTGFPIESTPPIPYFNFGREPEARTTAELQMQRGSASTSLQLSLNLPADFLAGYYRPFLTFTFDDVPPGPASPEVLNIGGTVRRPLNLRNSQQGIYLPIIRIGNPAAPRMFWTLLVDTLSNGSRGVRAIEDRNLFSIAQRIITQSETFIVPRTNPDTGQAYTYRLEPFVLTQSVGERSSPPQPPLIPLRFPSGNLTVRIQRPDGTRQVIGPSPFMQNRMKTPAGRDRQPLDDGGGHITDAYELSTMDPRFEVSFTQDGLHVITLEGTVEDIWGNVWTGGGTYEVYVARPLIVDTAVLPGTPFEVGDAFSPGVVVMPPVPASVSVRVRHLPNSDQQRTVDRTRSGIANRFGFFGASSPLTFSEPGEYRADVTASYTDAQGNLWMGSRTWGGVVAPVAPDIRLHGRRGIDEQQSGKGQWYFRTQTGVPVGTSHVNLSFHSGDVLWLQKSDAVIPELTFQDLTGSITSILNNRMRSDLNSLANDSALGEIAFKTLRPDGKAPHLDPSKADILGYSYAFIERPPVSVREEVRETFGAFGGPYWRFNDQYALQIGSGPSGDLPNDFKFQYGGGVLRGSALPKAYYDIYGSLFVLVPDNDSRGGTRVFPPFQGNGGGPSGGSLFTLKGKDIDAFIHLTAIRPGTVLEVGDMFSIAGALAPTLAGIVSVKITLPGGRIIQQAGRANRVGYYYHSENDFSVDEPGIYSVEVRVTFDGQISAGQLTAPFPSGDVLGSTNSRFSVYVVPRGTSLLATSLPSRTTFERAGTLDFTASAPAGTTIRTGHLTSTMPGFILETRDLNVSGGNLVYRYDPVALSRDFPNLDTNPPADVVAVTMFASITDSAGRSSYAARILTLRGTELPVPPTADPGITYNLSSRSGLSRITATSSMVPAVGYGRVQPAAAGTPPSGVAIFTLRQGTKVVGETAVPGTRAVLSGRVSAEIGDGVDTGIAIANPNSQAVTISFFFTDANGNNFGAGNTTIPAEGQLARFLSQAPFTAGSSVHGTFTFTSTQPVGAVALRGLTNERSQFLLTTVPIVGLPDTSAGIVILPHFADGGGWSTQVFLVNPADTASTGTIQFLDAQGQPFTATAAGETSSTFSYTIPPRSSYRLQTAGSGESTQAGSVRVTPSGSSQTPSVLGIFSFRRNGVTVSEFGVRADRSSTAFRAYAELSGTPGEVGSTQTGLAVANPSATEVVVNIELTSLSGVSTGLAGAIRVPPSGQTAAFLNQIPGLETLLSPFQGTMRITTSSAAGITVVALRGRYNEDGEFLIASTPPVDETAPTSQSELLFPHWAEGGGYTTQFIIFNVSTAPLNGALRLVSPLGLPIDMGLH